MDRKFKVVLIGDSETGKTSWVKCLVGDISPKYVGTIAVDVTCVSFTTNYGMINFNVWDTAGQEVFRGIGDGYYIGADAAIVFYDVTKPNTYTSVFTKWIPEFKKVAPLAPIVLCGNKIDIFSHEQSNIQHLPPHYSNHKVSAKNKYNITAPITDITRQLTGKSDIVLSYHSSR